MSKMVYSRAVTGTGTRAKCSPGGPALKALERPRDAHSESQILLLLALRLGHFVHVVRIYLFAYR
jgi:hypothetical protein